jgi:glutamyl-tRNA synthetase
LIPFFESAGYDVDKDTLTSITPLIQERMITLEDGPEKAGFFFKDEVDPVPEELVGKKMTPIESASAARDAYEVLSDLPMINFDTAEAPLRELAETLDLKAGQLFGIIRVAVTGQKVSPPLFESMEIIGREKVLERIGNAINLLDNLAES